MKMGRRTLWTLAISALALTGAPTAAGPSPARIVSLAPSVTEGIFLLGAGDRIVGDTVYCDRPPDAQRKEKVGTLLEPDVEKIISLTPDLVVGTEDGNDPRVLRKISGLGLTVAVIPRSTSFPDLCRNFLHLGGLAGETARAEGIVQDARERLARVRKRLEGKGPVTVFWEIGARPLVTAGRGGYLDEMTRMAGGENIAAGQDGAWVWFSREEVIRRNPDAIVMARMGDVGADERKTWMRYPSMKAVSVNRFLVLEPEDIGPLPTDFVSGVEKLARFLHPEAFEVEGRR